MKCVSVLLLGLVMMMMLDEITGEPAPVVEAADSDQGWTKKKFIY